MDDTEDDAGYPPNPYRGSHRRSFPTSNHSKAHSRNNSHRSQMPRGYPGDHGNEDDDEVDQAMNDAEDEEYDDDCNAGQEHLGTRSQLYVDHEEVGHDSSESKGKRRKLDRYTGGYELVARSAPTPALKPLPSRSSSAEWSEDSTFALLNSWGDRYLQNGRKSLRSDEWVEVAKTVCQGSKVLRSEAQCRNRLDTLKKKYKKEKAKHLDYGSSNSNWVYFQKMDELMSSPSPSPQPPQQHPQQPRLPCGIDAGKYVFASSSPYRNRSDGLDELGDSPGDTASEDEAVEVDDEFDGLPPRRDKVGRSSGSSVRVLDDSIQKFGEIYEKIENSKRQQMAELERMRKEFYRDLELKKKQILDRAQAEISRLRQEDGEEDRTDDDDNGDEDDDIDVSGDNLSG